MNNQQITALKCAYTDLQGVLQADTTERGMLGQYIDTQSIEATVFELEYAFPFLNEELHGNI